MNSDKITTNDSVALVFPYDENEELVLTQLLLESDDEVEISPLTEEEQNLRNKCEQIINEALITITDVGHRLFQIRSQKLFRSTHRSFGAYCKEVLGITRYHAKRLIKADACMNNLKKANQFGSLLALPSKPSHTRPIAELDPERQIQVAKMVKEKCGNRKPKAKDWQEAREELFPVKADSKADEIKISEKAEQPGPEENSNPVVVPMPSARPTYATNFITPAEFHKGIPLPSLTELNKDLTTLSYINWNSTRKPEREKLLTKLTKWMPLYAEWEQTILGATQQQEAA